MEGMKFFVISKVLYGDLDIIFYNYLYFNFYCLWFFFFCFEDFWIRDGFFVSCRGFEMNWGGSFFDVVVYYCFLEGCFFCDNIVDEDYIMEIKWKLRNYRYIWLIMWVNL